MTTLRAAAQQALEALEYIHSETTEYEDKVMGEAITALRAALAEPDNGGKTGWPPGLLQDDSRGLSKWLASRLDAKRRLREALAEPVQEPAANEIHGCHGGEGSTLPEQPVQEPHISAPSAQEGKTK